MLVLGAIGLTILVECVGFVNSVVIGVRYNVCLCSL